MTVDEIISAKKWALDPTYSDARPTATRITAAIHATLLTEYRAHQTRSLEAHQRGERSPERHDEALLVNAIRSAVEAHAPKSIQVHALCSAWRRECCPLDARDLMDAAASYG